MKKILLLLFIAFFTAALMFAGGQGEDGKEKTLFLTMGTGSPGGVYYPLGGGMAVVIEKTVPGVRCAAESTGASVENSRLVGIGDTDMGMVMGSVAYKAVKGEDPFEKSYPLMSLFQMYPAPEHIITTAQSGIKSFADLKGKRISIDVPGSGCSAMAQAMLKEFGFDLEKDVKLADLTQSESVQALKDGVVDACFFNFAYPASAVMDIAATRDLVMIPIDKDFCDRLVKKYPYYVAVTIPAGTYPKVERDILCLGDSNVMVCNEDMPEDIAYSVVKAIYENVSVGQYALTNIHPIAAQLTPENAVNSPVPLHPGAKRYFDELK
ncbi:MAG: TAXI family TRAP transporter solute-binding subunit [Spirochaetales bacterium]|nr:TAXI family TRAP transporter solute-binding subunit [Spirochaetales bacterium]